MTIPDPNADLADIRQKWLAFCPTHDKLDIHFDLPCICPTEDHRPVIAALVGEVETLRAEVARLRGRTHEAVDETQRRYATMQSELARLHQLMREARDRHAAEMRKAGKPAWSEISGYGQAAAASILGERDEARAEVARLEGERAASLSRDDAVQAAEAATLARMAEERDNAITKARSWAVKATVRKAEVDDLRVEVARLAANGQCGNVAPDLVLGMSSGATCTLRAGHLGWHEDGPEKSKWTYGEAPSDSQDELRRRDDAATTVIGCPDCGTILNAATANCTGLWHSDNRPTVESLMADRTALNADVAQLTADRDSLIKAGEALAAERDEAIRVAAERVLEAHTAIAERNDYRRRLDFAEVVAARMRAVAEAAEAYVTRYRVPPSDSLRPLFAAVDQMAPSTPTSTPQSDGQGEVAVTDAVEAPGALRCLCELVDVSMGFKGYTETRLGRKDPECPYHGRAAIENIRDSKPPERTLRARSCPNCHSIGAPRIIPGVPDMPCMDVWHDHV